jgi:enoyl-[acyl-carrier protein] reductase III
MKEYFQGKWALVLGASSGFGAATCRALAEAGCHIAGVHLDRKAGMAEVEKLIKELQNFDVQVEFFNINAADEVKRRECLEQLKAKASGKVHVLLHSLAFGTLKPFLAESLGESIQKSHMDMTLDVMANSLVYWAQDLNYQGFFCEGARIYAMTSAGSSRVWKSYGAVSAAKSALESHCRQLALEFAPRKIGVNAILAGVTDTPALRKIPGNESMIETAAKRNPMGRLTTPDDVGKAIVALSLPHCQFITGNTIRVDGGENVVE